VTNNNVIFLVPVYQSADLIEEWATYIRKLNPKPSKIIFCENNSTDGTLQKLIDTDFGTEKEIIRFWTVDLKDKKKIPFTHCYDIIAHARQLLLTRARVINPDYAFFFDIDVFPQDKDIIEAFTLWGKDIIGGAYPRVFPEGVYIATLFYSSTLKEKYPHWKKIKKLNRGVLTYEVHATSGGCLQLSRKAIQDRRLNFVPVPEGYSEDFGFCKTCRDNGYDIFLEATCLLGHKVTVRWRAWDIIRKDDNKRSKSFDDESMIKRIKADVKRRKELIAKQGKDGYRIKVIEGRKFVYDKEADRWVDITPPDKRGKVGISLKK